MYAVIAYMDTIAGVYFPRGGMRAVPDAMAAAAADAGVEFIYDSTVSELEWNGSRATAVHTTAGHRVAADAVVLTTELPDTYRLLGRTPRRLLKLRPAPSAVVAHVGCRAVGDAPAHPTAISRPSHDRVRGSVATDIRRHHRPGPCHEGSSCCVTRPTAGDPSLAPPGRDLLYILAPAPNTEVGQVDWDATSSAYVDEMLGAVTARLPQLGEDLEILQVVTPADWGRQGMAAGTPFALAHTLGQTGPFRPSNTVRCVDNVVLAGSSTVPGVGVPTAILSGRLAADRITGVSTRSAGSRGVPPMIGSELDAAGVRDPSLREAFRQCREINARDGKTFFLATRLLAPSRRPAVHALYGFARRADDILDDFDARGTELRAKQLQALSTQLFNSLAENQPCDDPTLTAVVHTARKYDIKWDLFDDFLASMRMDLTVTDYPDRAALDRYMYGSAEVIGLQLLPILGHRRPARGRGTVRGRARKSISAHQLHQGCRRGPEPRPGLPARRRTGGARCRPGAAELVSGQSAHRPPGAARTDRLSMPRRGRCTTEARPGIEMLAPASRPCVAVAWTLYSEILKRIEEDDFQIFGQRATVGKGRRLIVARGRPRAVMERATATQE